MSWEYKVITFTGMGSFWSGQMNVQRLESELNRLGRDDWELVAIQNANAYSFNGSVTATLKRSRK